MNGSGNGAEAKDVEEGEVGCPIFPKPKDCRVIERRLTAIEARCGRIESSLLSTNGLLENLIEEVRKVGALQSYKIKDPRNKRVR